MRVNGLYGHIRRNNAKSLALFLVFVVLIELLAAAIVAVSYSRRLEDEQRDHALQSIAGMFAKDFDWQLMLIPLSGCLCWLVIAWIFYRPLLEATLHAQPVDRRKEAALYNLVENLAIVAGLPMPAVYILEEPAINAFAAGFSPATACIGVTRGMLQMLGPSELEAVLAHEMTHIKNRDIRLMAVATLCMGIVSRMAWIIAIHNLKPGPRMFLMLAVGYMFVWEVAALVAWGCLAALVCAGVTRLAISRAREMLADAGAAELTKNPGALISALQKASGHDEIENLDFAAQAMMISPMGAALLSTHPTLGQRVDALRRALPSMLPPACAPVAVMVSAAKPTFGKCQANSFRAQYGSLATASSGGAVAADPASISQPGMDVSVLFTADFWSQLIAEAAILKPPAWISHPYVLLPALVINIVGWTGVGDLSDSRYKNLYVPNSSAGMTRKVVVPDVAPGAAVCAPLVRMYMPKLNPPAPFSAREVHTSDEHFRRGSHNGEAETRLFFGWRARNYLRWKAGDCPASTCTGKALDEYLGGFGGYVNERSYIAGYFDHQWGAPGLKFAQDYFDSTEDRAFVADFKQRLAAGKFTRAQTGYEDGGAALDLIPSKPIGAFVPCAPPPSDMQSTPAAKRLE